MLAPWTYKVDPDFVTFIIHDLGGAYWNSDFAYISLNPIYFFYIFI